jgi:EAL domain-containing protein (putative c-di-GMP-specific phosphodiesterase class I)
VIAEGVEEAAQLQRLRDLGCGQAQGFLLARPMAAAELEARCRREQLAIAPGAAVAGAA